MNSKESALSSAKLVQLQTEMLIAWLKEKASINNGFLPDFSNDEIGSVMGMEDGGRFSHTHGNIQSRIDFACYLCNLPPLGCASTKPYKKPWAQKDRNWKFPIAGMHAAAKARQWTAHDFEQILRVTRTIQGRATLIWTEAITNDEIGVKNWAEQFKVGELDVGHASVDDSQVTKRLSAQTLSRATPEYIWNAVQKFIDGKAKHSFSPSTDFDLIVDDGRRFPPKAVFGVALSEALGGKIIGPEHFSAGMKSTCFRLLRAAGCEIVPKDSDSQIVDIPISDPGWHEGKDKLVSHFKKERARGMVYAKRAQYRRLYGKLSCERCGLDPIAHYGVNQAESCIEVHHANTQVSKMADGHISNLDDLQCLCANCHRLVHRLMIDKLE